MLRPFLILALTAWLAVSALAQPLRPIVGKDRSHLVSSGENLYSIAKQYSLAIEHLCFANSLPIGLDVAVGKDLVVPTRRVLPANPPEDGLVINLPERGVFLFRQGQFEKFYPVAIGQPGRFQTPEGSFKLESRVENPTWLPPEWAGLGEVTVPAGPENPLGDRWMGLSLPGVGLHSTTSPTSIGAAASHGCMRMYPESARELFEKVTVGMPVRIEYEPVKVGLDEETGEVFVQVLPDVYSRYDLLRHTRERLQEAGVLPFVDEKLLERLVRRQSGRPELALQTQVMVTRGGQPLDAPLPGILKDGVMWISSDLARTLGLSLTWDAASRSVEVSRESSVVRFPVVAENGPADPPPAYLFQGRTLLPARVLLNAFSIPFRWDAPSRTLHLEG